METRVLTCFYMCLIYMVFTVCADTCDHDVSFTDALMLHQLLINQTEMIEKENLFLETQSKLIETLSTSKSHFVF